MSEIKKQNTQNAKQNAKRTVKVCGIVLAAYIVLAALFYLLVGEQLYFRQSRGDINMKGTESFAEEVAGDTAVTQTFVTQIDKIKTFSVRWGNYDRTNSGTLTMEVSRVDDGTVLAKQTFDVSQIANNGLTVIDLDQTLEGLRGVTLQIKLTSTSIYGQGVAPAVNIASADIYGGDLCVNGQKRQGALCLSVTGIDFVWTGAHYLEIAGAGAAIVFLAALIVVLRVNRGKKSLIYDGWRALKRYKFLIKQMVSRDFKTKYKRSVFGVLWSFLNPLLTSFVMYIVFSQLFRYEIDYYPVYLVSGVVLYNFFSECTNMCLTSITDNANLITKVYVPKFIYPLTRTLSSGINLLLALIPPIIIAFISGLFPTLAWLLIPYALVCLMIFSMGLGLLLSSAMVFFRDMRFLWGVITMMWMYLTPIFYPADVLGENFAWVLQVNPLYHIVTFVRSCLIGGISPEPIAYVWCLLGAVVMFAVGALVFKKTQDKFIHYL